MASHKVIIFISLLAIVTTSTQKNIDGQGDQVKERDNQAQNDQVQGPDDQEQIVQIEDELPLNRLGWVPCNFGQNETLSCYDCKTRLLCLPVGGRLINCWNPFKPYCRNGICSPIPSDECIDNTTEDS